MVWGHGYIQLQSLSVTRALLLLLVVLQLLLLLLKLLFLIHTRSWPLQKPTAKPHWPQCLDV